MDTSKTKKARGKSNSRRRNRMLKIVRRAHMYTGLVLLPWVILFGFSGMLFNHPDWFGPEEVSSHFSDRELREEFSLILPDAGAIADQVVSRLNARESSPTFVRSDAGSALIEGALVYQGKGKGGTASLKISPNGHGATVQQTLPSGKEEQEKPEFHGERFNVEGFQARNVEAAAERLFESAGIDGISSIEQGGRGFAEVRFQMESSEGDGKWNVVYGLGTGEVTARATDSSNGLNPYTLLTRLHKTHHYPDRRGARWFWTLIGDATGITMVFWGISGLLMWWQLKPTRLIGVTGLVVAVLIAGIVFSGTIAHHTFGPARARGGPSASAKGGPGKGSPDSRPAPATNNLRTEVRENRISPSR